MFDDKIHFSDFISLTSVITAFNASYKSDFYFKGEYHDFWEIVYVISGEIGVCADDNVFSLSTGDIVFHKPMEFHKLWAENGKEPKLFIMSFRLSGPMAKKLENTVTNLTARQQGLISAVISTLKHNCMPAKKNNPLVTSYVNSWDDSLFYTQTIKNYAELLFLDIIDECSERKLPYSNQGTKIYSNIVHIMNENVCDWISVDDIAKKCSFSAAYIKKIFSKYSDCGIHNYFLKLKIKKAIELMQNGMNVCEASDALSFGNANYFGVVFKREIGVSPSKYIKFLNSSD